MSAKSIDVSQSALPFASKLVLWGAVVLSVLWLGALIYFASTHNNSSDGTLKLNEWGDFLAGVFAPIAFLWLVVAVLLQSTELKEQRKELALTREEFQHNREVMIAQADEARKQAEYISTQTTIMSESYAATQARDILDACVDLVATRLVQYANAWEMHPMLPDGSQDRAGHLFSIRGKMYEGMTQPLVIASTVKTLRTQRRNFVQQNPEIRLFVSYPMDFQRVLSAISSSYERVQSLPVDLQIKANTMELGELYDLATFIHERIASRRKG